MSNVFPDKFTAQRLVSKCGMEIPWMGLTTIVKGVVNGPSADKLIEPELSGSF